MGNSVGHHHGFTPLLRSCFEMLEFAAVGHRGCLRLGTSQVCYSLMPFTDKVKNNIVRFVWLATVISGVALE